jgi:hypothetical protein
LREAARLAEALARELEDDAIIADYQILWRRYATELERAVRLAESDLSAEEIMVRLNAISETIGTPRGSPSSMG